MNLNEELSIILDVRSRFPVQVEYLVAALGLKLEWKELDEDTSGMIESEGNSFKITVNSTHSYSRQRFTIAHELGHYMMHRNLIGDGLCDDRMYRSKNCKIQNPNVGHEQERSANRFAANLLMPDELVKKQKNNVPAGEEPEKWLARQFQVSQQAMEIKLRNIS